MARSHLLKALKPARVSRRGRHGSSGTNTGTKSRGGTGTGTHPQTRSHG